MKVPSTKDEWMKIINKTYEKWNFPNAYAAADGNHILIIRQNNVSSEFYNCKGFHSIVLLEFVDHYYRYLVAEVGCQGRISDGGVYKNSAFHSSLKNELNLPDPMSLPKSPDPYWQHDQINQKVPMSFVAADAFSLSKYRMKLFSKKNLTETMIIFD